MRTNFVSAFLEQARKTVHSGPGTYDIGFAEMDETEFTVGDGSPSSSMENITELLMLFTDLLVESIYDLNRMTVRYIEEANLDV